MSPQKLARVAVATLLTATTIAFADQRVYLNATRPLDVAEQQLLIDDDTSEKLKAITSFAVGYVPVIGGLCSLAVDLFWPSGSGDNPGQVNLFEQMEEAIQDMIDTAVFDAYYQTIKDRMDFAYVAMNNYASSVSGAQTGPNYSAAEDLNTVINECQAIFVALQSDSDLTEAQHYFAISVPTAILHVSSLREEFLYKQKLTSESINADWQDQLEKTILDWEDYFDGAYKKWLEWRWNAITPLTFAEYRSFGDGAILDEFFCNLFPERCIVEYVAAIDDDLVEGDTVGNYVWRKGVYNWDVTDPAIDMSGELEDGMKTYWTNLVNEFNAETGEWRELYKYAHVPSGGYHVQRRLEVADGNLTDHATTFAPDGVQVVEPSECGVACDSDPQCIAASLNVHDEFDWRCFLYKEVSATTLNERSFVFEPVTGIDDESSLVAEATAAGLNSSEVGYKSDVWYYYGRPTCVGKGTPGSFCDNQNTVCDVLGFYGTIAEQMAEVYAASLRSTGRHVACPADYVLHATDSAYWSGKATDVGLIPSELTANEEGWFYGGRFTCVGYGSYGDLCDRSNKVCAGTRGTPNMGTASQQMAAVLEATLNPLGNELHYACPIGATYITYRSYYWASRAVTKGLDPNLMSVTEADWFYNDVFTCVGHSANGGEVCDTADHICAGGNTYGGAWAQLNALLAAVNNGGRHPDCPL